ncbi:MAG: protein kinase domain-containing protein [Candidatus Polarisedimenticolia bacterium]
MSAPGWERLESLFIRAMTLPSAERLRFARASCPEDPELRARLERLIEAETREPEFLETAVRNGAAAITRDLAASRTGSRIGPYRLVRILGEGGSGTVYLARRDDAQYDATVAIKLLHPGAASRGMIDRLRAERQILAQLDHPHIARLLDGGTTPQGEPYVVMEYVQGVPILEDCARRSMSGADRLRLFLQVCGAVEHAHRHLIVHRDLKPANVLVTAEGIPKLLDFGIAKLLRPGPDGGEAAADTTLAPLRMLTPGYASPEQIRGEPVTTAGDVYSLGVLLYELLTGRKPHDIHPGLPPGEMERRICSTEPPRPSAVPGVAAGTARWMRGDLDIIILKALRKEPSRRYATVREFSADIERFLAGRPVHARPETLFYVTGRFVRRHRIGVTAGAIAAAIVLASLVAALLQSARARAERDRAEHIASMLVGMFEIASPGRVDGITVQDLLDHGEAQIEKLADQPDTQAVLMQTLGDLHEKSGEFSRAAALYARVVGHQESRGKDPAALASAVHHLGRAVARAGDYLRAVSLFRRSLGLRRTLDPGGSAEVASTLNALGLALHEIGQFEEAEQHYREALQLDVRLLGPEHVHTILVRGNLALLLHDTGQPVEAEALYRSILATLESRAVPDEHQVSEMSDGLGLALEAQGRDPEAAGMFRRSLAIRRKIHGEDSYLVARSMSHLGLALAKHRDLEEAEALLKDAEERRRRLLGETHMEFAETQFAVATLRAAQARWEEAAARFERAATIYRTALGPRHPLVGESLLQLALARRSGGHRADGCRALNEGLSLLGSKDPRAAKAREGMSDCL